MSAVNSGVRVHSIEVSAEHTLILLWIGGDIFRDFCWQHNWNCFIADKELVDDNRTDFPSSLKILSSLKKSFVVKPQFWIIFDLL